MKKIFIFISLPLLLWGIPASATVKRGVVINETNGNQTFYPYGEFTSVEFVNDYEEPSVLETEFITIENSTYVAEAFPEATVNQSLEGIELSDQVMNGAFNFITVHTTQEISLFYIGIKDVEGYLVYDPNSSSNGNGETNTRAEEYSYVIPLLMSNEYEGDCELIISGQLSDGNITQPSYFPLTQIETRVGDLEVKLAFSNEKDVDIHLITPSGIHIYYSNSYDGKFEGEVNGVWGVYDFGLDIDSNAGCSIDGINKENIYIPAEFVEAGEYTVLVDLYSNCDPSIPTTWSVTTWYMGQLVKPSIGENPASGIFEIGAQSSYADYPIEVMRFTIRDIPTAETRSGSPVKSSITHEEFRKNMPQAQKEKINY